MGKGKTVPIYFSFPRSAWECIRDFPLQSRMGFSPCGKTSAVRGVAPLPKMPKHPSTAGLNQYNEQRKLVELHRFNENCHHRFHLATRGKSSATARPRHFRRGRGAKVKEKRCLFRDFATKTSAKRTGRSRVLLLPRAARPGFPTWTHPRPPPSCAWRWHPKCRAFVTRAAEVFPHGLKPILLCSVKAGTRRSQAVLKASPG